MLEEFHRSLASMISETRDECLSRITEGIELQRQVAATLEAADHGEMWESPTTDDRSGAIAVPRSILKSPVSATPESLRCGKTVRNSLRRVSSVALNQSSFKKRGGARQSIRGLAEGLFGPKVGKVHHEALAAIIPPEHGSQNGLDATLNHLPVMREVSEGDEVTAISAHNGVGVLGTRATGSGCIVESRPEGSIVEMHGAANARHTIEEADRLQLYQSGKTVSVGWASDDIVEIAGNHPHDVIASNDPHVEAVPPADAGRKGSGEDGAAPPDDREGKRKKAHYIGRNLTKKNEVHRDWSARLEIPISGNSVAAIIKHPYFDMLSGALILLNTLVIGCETDYMAKHSGMSSAAYAILRNIFNAAFTLELVLRVVGEKSKFLLGSDVSWNCFDLLMVISAGTEIIFQALDLGRSSSVGRVLRVLRIVRILRALRLGRVLRYARTLKQITYALQSSMGTLFWAMVMIFLVVYCFAICFCQAVTEYLVEAESSISDTDREIFMDLWHGVPQSLYSLYLAMTGGRNWGEVIQPLMGIGWVYTTLFMVYISAVFFGVLNVVTAIFVDSALQSQQYHKDLLIQEKVERKQLYHDHLRSVFHQIDHDQSGCINGDEMEYFLTDPNLNMYLESIDIFPNDARALFRLLDHNNTGDVSIEEFCDGCFRLKGEAKSFDIHCLIFNIEVLQQSVDAMYEKITAEKRKPRPRALSSCSTLHSLRGH